MNGVTRMMFLRCGAAALAVAASSSGCGATLGWQEIQRLSAIDRAAAELTCDRREISAEPRRDLNRDTWDVTACGHQVRYVCRAGSDDTIVSAPAGTRFGCIREPRDSGPAR
jgi:hypothetical protein